MKIVCICVTEDRPAFMPWLQWNFEKQTHQDKQLLVIDSSQKWGGGLTCDHEYHGAPHGVNVSVKRNMGLDLADGDAIAWMDDDDWQHPQRLKQMAEVMAGQKVKTIVGTTLGWFYNLSTGKSRIHSGCETLFNSCLVPMHIARSARFPESKPDTGDTPWMRAISVANPPRDLPWVAHAWLCHETNLCNPAGRKRFDSSDISIRIGEAWGWETNARIGDLRERLGLCTCIHHPSKPDQRIQTEGCPVHLRA